MGMGCTPKNDPRRTKLVMTCSASIMNSQPANRSRMPRFVEVVVRHTAFVANIVDECARLNFLSLSGEIRFVRLERDHQDSAGNQRAMNLRYRFVDCGKPVVVQYIPTHYTVKCVGRPRANRHIRQPNVGGQVKLR